MTPAVAGASAAARVAALDWPEIEASLFAHGYARIPALLRPAQCEEMRGWYADDARFRSRVVMQAHGFGRGEYRYFTYPLPALVAELRAAVYGRLAPIANRWMGALREDGRYPPDLEAFLERCHTEGQVRPTPLLLKYETGDWNALHQDLYGDLQFPFQMTCFLSRRGEDYEGGAFVLVEQRPRAQSRPEVIEVDLGDVLIFTTRYRPAQGTKGTYRAGIKHGVSRLLWGERYALGIIFHDAR